MILLAEEAFDITSHHPQWCDHNDLFAVVREIVSLTYFAMVSYLGLNSLFGRITTNLLKQSPGIDKLTLYDDGAPPHAIEHPNVYFGRDSLQDAIKDVNIVVIGDEGGEIQGEDRLRVIGPKVIRYTEAIIKFSPNAIVIVAVSPLNILFPLIGNFLGPDWQDRLLGTTSVDTLRASRALDGLLNDPQGLTHILPVIGGNSYSTRVPLFSHVCPQITVSNDIRDKIVEKMKLFDSPDAQDMDAIERAYSTVRFIHSVLTGMTRDTSVPEIAMAKTSGVPQTNYFSLPILIGRKGIERAADLPKLDETEEKLFLEAALKLSEESQKAAVLSKQFSDQNEAEDLKKQTVLKLKNTNFHEVGGKKPVCELQLKKKYKDPVPYSFRGGRSKKRQNSAKKMFLGLPCVEKAPASKSPEINKCSANGHQKSSRNNLAEAQENALKDEPVSDYSELLNKEVSDHLMSLKFGPEGIQRKPNLTEENTDDEFTETLQFEVEEHLNSFKHSKQPRNLNSQSKNMETMVSGVDAEGKSERESWGTSEQFVLSSSGNNKSDSSRSTDTPNITLTTPFERTNKAIMDSKPIKFQSKSAKSTDFPPAPLKSPSAQIDSAIRDLRIKPPRIDSETGLDLAKLEDKDAKKELRPDGSSIEKSISELLAGGNVDAKKLAPVEEMNEEEQIGDAKRELRPARAAAPEIKSRGQIVNRAEPDDAKKELRPRDNEFADNTAEAHDAGLSVSADAKKELRPRDHSADSLRTKTENANVETTKEELGPPGTGRAGVDQHAISTTDDAKKELRPRGESANESGSPKSKQNIRQGGTKVRTPKVRGKVNKHVLNTFEADRSSGDHMSKSQIMMLKRKQKNEEKAGKDKSQRVVGEDGDAAKPDDTQEVKGKITLDEVEASQHSVAKSGSAKTRSVGRIGRRAVPLRRSSDKRKHRGKIVFSEGKWKTQEEGDEARASPPEAASEIAKIVPNVSTNTAKRINSAITDMKVRTSKRRAETWKSSHHDPKPAESPDEITDAVTNVISGSLTSKRIDSAITDAKPQKRERSPSPKAVDFKPSHKQPDVSSHLLTDAARVAKLNSLHKTSSEEFNIEKTVENRNIRFEPDFKVDVNKKLQRGENKKQVSKPPSMEPKSRKSDQTTSPRNTDEDAEDRGNLIGNDKDLTSDKTMNYFMRQRQKGPIDQINAGSEEVQKAGKEGEQPKHKKRQSGRNEGDKRKKHRRPRDHDKNTKNVSETEKNSSYSLNYSRRSNQPEKVTKRKDIKKEENDQEPDDPWDSKYFTKASEMFFKMFRDTVTCKPSNEGPIKSDSHKSQDVFLGQPQKYPTEMKANPFQSEQSHKNDTLGAQSIRMESQCQALKSKSDSTKPSNGIRPKQNLDESSKNGEIHCKTSLGKINVKFDKPVDVKCKMHPEASTKTSDMCGNVKFHVNTRNQLPSCKESPKEENAQKNSKDSNVSFDKLYEESSTVPIIIGAKGDKSWRSVGSGEKAQEKYVPSKVLHDVVATSDKGRGDAVNKVDFTVCRMPENGIDAKQIGEISNSNKNGRNESSRGLKAAPMKIPIMSKTIKQVSIPYQLEVVPNKAEDPQKTDKSYKWERIVNVFKNIIISDIEGARPRFLLENPPNVPTISTANIAKPVPPPPKKPVVAPQEAKRGVFKVKSKSEQAKKKKYETAKKKRPSESKKGHVIKNNPKKIVNYFSKRGASASAYEKSRFDGRRYDQSEGLMSQTSAGMGQNSASYASPSKIK